MGLIIPTTPSINVFLTSAAVCALIVLFPRMFSRHMERRRDVRAVQAAHVAPTPRIGGLAIGLAILVALMIAPGGMGSKTHLFGLSLLPVFAAGLMEDLGHRISPLSRLVAAAASSIVAIAVLGFWLPRFGVPGLDAAMTFAPVAIALTVFATAGICNAFNLIDGVNGLAASTGIVAALGLSAIAARAGDGNLAGLAIVLVAALAGFLIFNFPFGRIFLGDAGAYSLGHVLSWSGIALVARDPEVSPWAILLLFFWPVADTFFAIYRRRRSGRRTDHPDRLHYHQLVMRGLEIGVFGRRRRRITNPLTTLVMIPMIALPALSGVWFWNAPLPAFLCVLLFSVLFIATYLAVLALASRRARFFRRRLSPVPQPESVPGE